MSPITVSPWHFITLVDILDNGTPMGNITTSLSAVTFRPIGQPLKLHNGTPAHLALRREAYPSDSSPYQNPSCSKYSPTNNPNP